MKQRKLPNVSAVFFGEGAMEEDPPLELHLIPGVDKILAAAKALVG